MASDYARLKRELAGRQEIDGEAYTNGKAPFIAEVLAAALGSHLHNQ